MPVSQTDETFEFITIPEWGRRIGISRASAYRAAAAGEIPGSFSVGKLVRVNWPKWLDATGQRCELAGVPVDQAS